MFTVCEIILMNEKLVNWKNELGLDTKGVADSLGCSVSMASMLLNGKRKPSSEKRIEYQDITNGQVTYTDW